MTKFEQIGINHLYFANTKEQLNHSFNHSCNCCCYKGIHLNCDQCAIAATHSLLMSLITDENNKQGEQK